MQITSKKPLADGIFASGLLILIVFAFFRLSDVKEGMQNGLLLCFNAIIPTLFPFFVLTDLLLSFSFSQKILTKAAAPFSFFLKLSSYGGIAFLLGNVFGFPMGAKTVCHYYSEQKISKEESERLLLFSGNASPFFLLGSVGLGMLHSLKIGVFLFLLQFLFSFLLGCLLTIGKKAPLPQEKTKPLSKKIVFSVTVQNAVMQTLFICGYILFFSVLISLLSPLVSNPYLLAFLASCFEIGNGSARAASLSNFHLSVAFTAFSIVFSGLSVYFQTLDCVEKTDLKAKNYIPIKFVGGFFAFLITLIFA